MKQQKGQNAALIMSTIAMMVSFSVWGILSPMAQDIKAQFELNATQTSILISTPVILGSIMRIPMGILADKYSGRKVYTFTMLFLILPLIGASFVDSYVSLLFFVFFMGVSGATFSIAITYISGWYPKERQGFALGIAGVGNIGTAIAGFIVPLIVSAYSIAWAFRILAVAIGIMAIIFYFTTKDREQTGTKTFAGALEALKFKQTWLLSLFYFLTFGVFVAFGNYLPTLLQSLFDLTSVDAGRRAAGFIILTTAVRPIGGILADRLNPKQMLTYVFLGVAVGAIGLSVFNTSIILFTVFCLTIALFAGVGNGVVFKLVPYVSPSNTGAITGIVGAAGGIGGFFPPILLGVVKDMTGQFFLGFFLLAIFTIMCLLINFKREKMA